MQSEGIKCHIIFGEPQVNLSDVALGLKVEHIWQEWISEDVNKLLGVFELQDRPVVLQAPNANQVILVPGD